MKKVTFIPSTSTKWEKHYAEQVKGYEPGKNLAVDYKMAPMVKPSSDPAADLVKKEVKRKRRKYRDIFEE